MDKHILFSESHQVRGCFNPSKPFKPPRLLINLSVTEREGSHSSTCPPGGPEQIKSDPAEDGER